MEKERSTPEAAPGHVQKPEDEAPGEDNDLITHEGEEVNVGRSDKQDKDSFRYRGTLEENVTPVTPPRSDFMDETDDTTNPARDITPG